MEEGKESVGCRERREGEREGECEISLSASIHSCTTYMCMCIRSIARTNSLPKQRDYEHEAH